MMLPDRAVADSLQEQLDRACAELSRRLRSGENCTAEEFLTELPALSGQSNHALQLVFTEIAIRLELGQPLKLSDWCARFPQYRQELERHFQIKGLLSESIGGDPATVAATPQPPDTEEQVEDSFKGRSFGHYQLFEKVGHGGMGVVYRARDTILNRIVALKMIRNGALARDDEVRRFYREARAAAQLQHRHIVPIHEIGQHQGQHYFTMAFVSGGSLAGQRARFHADLRAAAGLVEKIASAVHVAHSRGILHRDLKPANVLLDEQGEPLVTDFGLAKLLDVDVELTQTGQIVGTPAYMAPEQAAGHARQVGTASDVWALGVLLYELVTGQRPFVGQGFQEMAQQIMKTDASKPRLLRPGLDRAVETIILKCLEKEPARRYSSAEALANDLARWLRGEPILARPEGWPRRIARTARRHRTWISVIAVVGLVAAIIFAYFHFSDPDRQLKAIHSKLADGQKVELIGDRGEPAWSKWSTGDADILDSPVADGAYTLKTGTLSLLELVRDPQQATYRFSAEVRINEPRHGQMGIYFGHTKHTQGQNALHILCDFTFRFKASAKQPAGQIPPIQLSLKLRQLGEAAGVPKTNETASLLQKEIPASPNAAAAGDWHQLDVVVAPEKIQVYWEGKLLTEITRNALQSHAALLAEVPDWKKFIFEFVPRGSLGLFAYRGSVSFRNVVIQPLTQHR